MISSQWLGGNDGGVWMTWPVVKYISKFMDNPRPSEARSTSISG